MTFLSNLTDILRQTAYRKHRAAQARFEKAGAGRESPREVTVSACEQIAAAFASDGFTYAKSKGDLTRRTADFSFVIHFQSDRNNVAGEHVGLWIHANVHSKRLHRWQTSQAKSIGVSGGVAGGQMGNLLKKKGWLEWELADPKLRPEVVADAVRTIREVALPYFSQFKDIPSLLRRLSQDDVAEVRTETAIELALCYSDTHTAQSILAGFFERNPQLLVEYQEAVTELRLNGLPPHSEFNQAKAIAQATIAYGLDPVGFN